ncbi:fimbrial protein [Aeromonas sanarellii]
MNIRVYVKRFSYFIYVCLALFVSQHSVAFTCVPGLTLNSTTTIPVVVDEMFFENMSDKGSAHLFNLASSVICSGWIHSAYQDAVKIEPDSAKLGPMFEAKGLSGFFLAQDNNVYDFTAIPDSLCAWPDAACSHDPSSNVVNKTEPMHLIIGVHRHAPITEPFFIPAGTEIAKFRLKQRGVYVVGGPPVFGSNFFDIRLTTKHDISVPSKTCSVQEESVLVRLPNIDAYDLRKMGAGRYPRATEFSLNLACDPGARVDVRFDATPMGNHTDVIANSAGTAEGVGIQVMDKAGSSVVLGDEVRVITSAEPHETLNYDAFYYYDGGALSPGTVKGLATVVFDYM